MNVDQYFEEHIPHWVLLSNGGWSPNWAPGKRLHASRLRWQGQRPAASPQSRTPVPSASWTKTERKNSRPSLALIFDSEREGDSAFVVGEILDVRRTVLATDDGDLGLVKLQIRQRTLGLSLGQFHARLGQLKTLAFRSLAGRHEEELVAGGFVIPLCAGYRQTPGTGWGCRQARADQVVRRPASWGRRTAPGGRRAQGR